MDGILFFVSVLKLVENQKVNLIACTRIDQYGCDFSSSFLFMEKNSGVYFWPDASSGINSKIELKNKRDKQINQNKGHTRTYI